MDLFCKKPGPRSGLFRSKHAQTGNSHVYVIANMQVQGYFCSIILNMKAVYQNTLLSLFCLASVVLAAPTQNIAHPQPLVQSIERSTAKTIERADNQCIESNVTPEIPLSIEEGSVRFACW